MVVVAPMFISSCKDRKAPTNLTSSWNADSTIVENITVSSFNTSPFDTLNFLNLDVLLSFQEDERGYLFGNILAYNLSGEIRLVRNELFARRGYIFRDTLLLDYFSRKNWYIPKYSSLDSIVLTTNEIALVDTLLKYERKNLHLTRKSFQQIFLNEFLMKPDSSGWGISVPLTLWTQAIFKNQNITMSRAPWDYVVNAYTIRYADTPHDYYHCILNYWCGAEGSGCQTNYIYVLDECLNVLDRSGAIHGWFSFEKLTENKYRYSVAHGADHNDPIEEEEIRFYEITKDGRIQPLDN